MYTLKNSGLTVTIEAPGERYRGSRYDWSSFITDICLDGKHSFTSVEGKKRGDGAGGAGLCGEFCMTTPPGYKETRVGDFFPKIGVGTVKKSSSSPYDFYEPAEFRPLAWQAVADERTVDFFCHQELINGFAYDLYKCISIWGSTLQVDYRLDNTGERRIQTDEYSHNYLCFNDAKTSSDYALNLNFETRLKRATPAASYLSKEFRFNDDIAMPFFCNGSVVCPKSAPRWTLKNEEENLSVSETLSLPIQRFALFGQTQAICPEMFGIINVAPGKSLTWKRCWTFCQLDAKAARKDEAQSQTMPKSA